MNIFDQIEAMRKANTAFCIATVVRTADVTSAKAGAKAIITETGDILGHLGGGCVQRAVREAAQTMLATGGTTMIRVQPNASTAEDGIKSYKSGCPSGGTVDILIETFKPEPRLAIFGTGPIAQAIAAHGQLARLRVSPTLAHDSELPALEPADFIIIASQGQNDLACLRQAMAAPCQHVAMIASHRKAAFLKEKLTAEAIPAERLACLKAPAGLDIGALDPHEIALSVLAELVQWRRSGVNKD